jgi:ABC-type multidrug transport system ATPase subunit
MPHGEVAIEARGLSKAFGPRTVLEPMDFQLLCGEAVALVGANGTGKTTLLRCLAGATSLTSGTVLWFGRLSPANAAARRLMGWLGHEGSLYLHLTVRENLLFAARMYGVPRPAQRLAELLRSARLQPHADRLARTLSQGMRQRVAILRSIVHDPRILLFDEPTAALDADGRDWLVELLRERIAGECALCFASHDSDFVRDLADRVLLLSRSDVRIADVSLETAGH